MTVPGSSPPVIAPLGDQALTVTFAARVDAEAAARVSALRHQLQTRSPVGVIELVPGYVALTVHYRPTETDYESLRRAVADGVAASVDPVERDAGRLVTIPVRYDGPDLAEVATATGLQPDQVIARHAGREYRVVLLGFVPGFAYLTGLDPALELPRRSAPRPRVPAGSVAIAGAQTGVYPAATPGGWHLLGTTTSAMFDPTRRPPNLLEVGDRVRFEVVR